MAAGEPVHEIARFLQAPGEWNSTVCAWVIKRTEHWVVMVTPMLFNDRVLISTHEEMDYFWTAGWCYDKGAAAVLAANAFDPETETDPVGFKKLAADNRRTHREVAEVNARLTGWPA